MSITYQSKSNVNKSVKSHDFITNIRNPYAKTWDKRNTSVLFEIANIHFSMANALRRIMIAQVTTVGFRSEPYNKSTINMIINDSPLHNQMMAHRIAMIPINIPTPEKFDIDDYLFIINVVNNTNSIRLITTEDFQIKQISTNKMLSRADIIKFFPPDPITGDYIILTSLNPKYFTPYKLVEKEVVNTMSKDFNKPVNEPRTFNIEAKATIGNGAENGHYSPVSCACYINTVDPQRAELGLKDYIDKQNELAITQKTVPIVLETLKRRFDLNERARYFYINDKNEPSVFTFNIETVGVIPPLIIFHRAIDILKNKINMFISNLISKNENIITINASKQLNGGYDIIVKDEDDTLGNIIQSHLCMLYAEINLPKDQRKLKYIGYKRPHPLENHIIFAIHGNTDNIDSLIGEIIKPGCIELIKMLNKIQNELEGSNQFIIELKQL